MIAAPVLLFRRIWYGYTFRKIKLVNYHKCAIVSYKDYYELKGYVWYAHFGRNKKLTCASRFAPEFSHIAPIMLHRQLLQKEVDEKDLRTKIKHVIDHINNNPLDNRRLNLRVVTGAQNSLNRSPNRNKSSRYKGVSKKKDNNRFTVDICYQGKSVRIGTFEDEIEAAKAYDAAAKKYFGDFAYLNFPDRKLKGLRDIIFAFFCKR
jgi:hypothetical protein